MADDEARRISCAEARASGLKRYFTGKSCPYGHIDERYVSSRWCVSCVALKKSGWAENNKAHVAEYNRAFYARDVIANRTRTKIWVDKNPDKVKINKQREYARNKSRYRESARSYRASHKETIKIDHARRAALNPERYAAYKRNRKARKRNADGHHTSLDVLNILRLQKHKCACCRVLLTKIKYHVDHIIPLAKGGDNWPRNLQILCAPCNQSKSARDPIEFMQAQGKLL